MFEVHRPKLKKKIILIRAATYDELLNYLECKHCDIKAGQEAPRNSAVFIKKSAEPLFTKQN